MFQLKATVTTSVGLIRQNNEDNFSLFGKYKEDTLANEMTFSAVRNSTCEVAAVFDGMGGEEAGELASLIAASELKPVRGDDINAIITDQIMYLNDRICQMMINRGGIRMGTTFAGAFFVDDRVVCVNVGDSRCYMIRDNELCMISHDHSEGQRMIDMGLMTEAEARNSRKWHVLTQCLGVYRDEYIISPYFSDVYSLRSGDRFLLCTDGVTDLLSKEDLEECVIGTANETAVRSLVLAAMEAGGRDNATVLVIDVI